MTGKAIGKELGDLFSALDLKNGIEDFMLTVEDVVSLLWMLMDGVMVTFGTPPMAVGVSVSSVILPMTVDVSVSPGTPPITVDISVASLILLTYGVRVSSGIPSVIYLV